MAQDAEKAADLTAVRGDGDPGVVVGGEDVVEDALGAGVLGARGLSDNTGPELVVLGEARLDLVVREEMLDVGLGVAAVAGVG